MQWSVTIDNKETRVRLPNQIPNNLPFEARIGGETTMLRWHKGTNAFFVVEEAKNGVRVERPIPIRNIRTTYNVDDGKTTIDLEGGGGFPVALSGAVGRYVFGQENRDKAAKAKGATIRSPMTGKVLKVLTANGEAVEAGEILFIVEAMKMENKIIAPSSGEVSGIKLSAGDQVSVNAVLAKIK